MVQELPRVKGQNLSQIYLTLLFLTLTSILVVKSKLSTTLTNKRQ